MKFQSEDGRIIVDEEEVKELVEEFDIQLEEVIGEGSFGVVLRGRDLSDGSLCAVKVIQKNKEKYSSIEISILSGLDHPNIVKFKKFFEMHQNKYIVMEYIENGNLQQLIDQRRKQKNPFNQMEITLIMNGLVSALKSMHINNVIHRDIKPENILIADKEDLSRIKLSDFGLSVKYKDGASFSSYSQKCGTISFMAPEILEDKQYSKPVDIWSCGIILYMLFSLGKHPFKKQKETKESYLKRISAINPSKPCLSESVFPSELAKDLFVRMMTKEQSNRYTASQVLQHPFITGKQNASIPLNFQEITVAFQRERRIIEMIQSIMMINFIKHKLVHSSDHNYKTIKLPAHYNNAFFNSEGGVKNNQGDNSQKEGGNGNTEISLDSQSHVENSSVNIENENINYPLSPLSSFIATERSQKQQQIVLKQQQFQQQQVLKELNVSNEQVSIHKSIDFDKSTSNQTNQHHVFKGYSPASKQLQQQLLYTNHQKNTQYNNYNKLGVLNKIRLSLPQAASEFLGTKQCVAQPTNKILKTQNQLAHRPNASFSQIPGCNTPQSSKTIKSPMNTIQKLKKSLKGLHTQSVSIGKPPSPMNSSNIFSFNSNNIQSNNNYLNFTDNINNTGNIAVQSSSINLPSKFQADETPKSELPQILSPKIQVDHFSAKENSKRESIQYQYSLQTPLHSTALKLSENVPRPKHPSLQVQATMSSVSISRRSYEQQFGGESINQMSSPSFKCITSTSASDSVRNLHPTPKNSLKASISSLLFNNSSNIINKNSNTGIKSSTNIENRSINIKNDKNNHLIHRGYQIKKTTSKTVCPKDENQKGSNSSLTLNEQNFLLDDLSQNQKFLSTPENIDPPTKEKVTASKLRNERKKS